MYLYCLSGWGSIEGKRPDHALLISFSSFSRISLWLFISWSTFKKFSFYIMYSSLKRQLMNTTDKNKSDESGNLITKYEIKGLGFLYTQVEMLPLQKYCQQEYHNLGKCYDCCHFDFFFSLTQDQSVFCCCSFFTLKEGLGQIFRCRLYTWSISSLDTGQKYCHRNLLPACVCPCTYMSW